MEFNGRRVTVMGLGRFGGGVGVARFLLAQGAKVVVTDLGTEDDLADSVAAVGAGATFRLGGHQDSDFTDTDLVVVNPAVKPGDQFLDLARRSGVPVTTEINLFFERCPARVIGVTGSVGKTTTASMIGRALAADGSRPVWVGGNIGGSLLADIDRMTGGDLVVLELSSAQLYRLAPTGLAPNVSVVTNLSPNHIDWHGSMESYAAAKKHILANRSPNAVAVLNYDDPVVRGWANDATRTLFFSTGEQPPGFARAKPGSAVATPGGVFVRQGMIVASFDGGETEVLDIRAMKAPGAHNVANAAAAVAACLAVGADLRKAGAALAGFEGAEHRLEFVRDVGGVRFFNDSKATTPESTAAALRAFREPVVLILGGRDKGADYGVLAGAVGGCRAAVLMGEMAVRLSGILADSAPGLATTRASTMERAVRSAAALARPGDIVLLSPACTSYDMFRNFEERGRAFKDAASALTPGDIGGSAEVRVA